MTRNLAQEGVGASIAGISFVTRAANSYKPLLHNSYPSHAFTASVWLTLTFKAQAQAMATFSMIEHTSVTRSAWRAAAIEAIEASSHWNTVFMRMVII